jgi:hypothetical protein
MKAHYFNYLPNLPEKEIRYRHPCFALEVNQIGMVFPDEGWEITHSGLSTWNIRQIAKKKITLHLGTKAKFVWECYSNLRAYRTQIHFSNGNFLDYSIKNLVSNTQISNKERAAIYAWRKEFISNTISHMLEKDKVRESKGLCKKKYWDFMMLPDLLAREYDAVINNRPLLRKRTVTQAQRDKKMEDILDLHNQGYPKTVIAQKMGIVNKSVVTYWLNKALSEKDI